jgi:hypothetical protein
MPMMQDDENKKSNLVCIVPALPGWFVGLFVDRRGEDGEGFVYDPIIAWELKRERSFYHQLSGRSGTFVHCTVTPITCEGCIEDDTQDGNWAIKRPDGSFDIPGDRAFETEAQAIAYFRERIDDDAARAAAKLKNETVWPIAAS